MNLVRAAFALMTLVVAASLAVPSVTVADHKARIVLPYGQDERWVPVVAGYEVVPRPLQCGVGSGQEIGVLYKQDFETPPSDLKFGPSYHAAHGNGKNLPNLFHVTGFRGKGTDFDHSLPNRLYFGVDAKGTFDAGHGAGVAEIPSVVVPATPLFLSWKDKWEVEAFLGYDHMWVEMVDVAANEVYVLCSTDPASRPDKSSSQNTIGACSPYREGVCPVTVRGNGGTGFGVELSKVPAQKLDPSAPHWENRYVQVPPEFAGRTVVLRFSVDTSDPVSNNFMGWMIDDILLSGAVLPESFLPKPNPTP